tara:strand:- start:42 stop:281 length:240 start_codon:yes stop_codon:yes gene_type:complete
LLLIPLNPVIFIGKIQLVSSKALPFVKEGVFVVEVDEAPALKTTIPELVIDGVALRHCIKFTLTKTPEEPLPRPGPIPL